MTPVPPKNLNPYARELLERMAGHDEAAEIVIGGGQKVFSFQISRRTVYLDEAIPAEWQPVWIETLRDNAASRMVALVERGAPRDLRDIYELCHRGLLTVAECWRLWLLKNRTMNRRWGRTSCSSMCSASNSSVH